MTSTNPRKGLLALLMLILIAPGTLLAEHHGNPAHHGEGKMMKKKGQVDEALIILSSASLQTQGMAMVLGNTLAKNGVQMHVLLCDQAGDLALKNSESTKLAPKDVSPKMLLAALAKKGARISVCALYLPNSPYTSNDLSEGVAVATPTEIAALMRKRHTRVFTF